MTELRKEPITRMWVVTMTDHPKGPSDYLSFKPPYRPQESDGPCPFCPGNERMTPRETFCVGGDGGSWAVRVVPNKFPFFHIEGDFDRRPEGMYDLMEAIGAHEIVIESREHQQNLATLDPKQIENILLAYQERLLDLERDHRFQQFLIIKNYPGVFNRHPHSHLMALPVIPKRIDEEISGVARLLSAKGALHLLRHYKRRNFCGEEGRIGDGPFPGLLSVRFPFPLRDMDHSQGPLP